MSDLDQQRPADASPSFTRAEFAASTAACQSSVLTPVNDMGLDSGLRHALAARMCRSIGQLPMAQLYDAGVPAELTGISRGEASDQPQLAAILRHVDLVTEKPAAASRSDIEALTAADLTIPQIVALSELIAFVNYETRIQQGHSLLKDRA